MGGLGRTGGPYQLVAPGTNGLKATASSPLLLGARLGPAGEHLPGFDGKIAKPLLLDRAPDAVSLMDIMNFGADRGRGRRPRARTLGLRRPPRTWDSVVELSGNGHDGSLLNAPSLGVLGPPDNGGERGDQLPDGPPFDAVHLHTDDLDDSAWPDTHLIEVPADAGSGLYALQVSSTAGEIHLPFVVRPRRELPVLMLVPTYTWQAYANLGRDPLLFPGLSHYALHRDGSPVYITTRLKPAPSTGPRARVEVDGVDSFISDDEAARRQTPHTC